MLVGVLEGDRGLADDFAGIRDRERAQAADYLR
jgi:hypothetical protein